MAYRNKDVEGMIWLFGILFVGLPVGVLAGIGIGGYFVGAAIGLAGFTAVAAGGGIILGGLVALGLVGLGVWGIVAGIMSAVEKRQQKKQQQENNNKPDMTVDGSTKTILQAAAPQIEKAKELPKNPDEMPMLQNVNVEAAAMPEVTKPSFFSKLAGLFKRKKIDDVQPEVDTSPSLSK
ncbi:MAG TPA: hypothetical protein VL360_01130 [Gammaproteobacteria bacterium]|jgi:hypothetical protein|nr:hypothetical protein [Gammaproteobacteria bacterium]